MARELTAMPKPSLAQDHPIDRSWLKKVFDTVVGPEGLLADEHIKDFLICFYRARTVAGELGGTTLSGFYVPPYPPVEELFLKDLCASGPVPFMAILDALQVAQASLVPPEAPIEYNSNFIMRNDMSKHTRQVLGPNQRYRKPLTTSQEVGWELGNGVPGDTSLCEGGKHPFHLRTSATTQFKDAEEKHTWGRSIGGEFSLYASRKLLEFGGFGIGI